MSTPTPLAWHTAEQLDRFLGDPDDAGARMPDARTLADDDARRFPDGAAAALNEWGLHRYYIPPAVGGDFDDALRTLLLMRQVSRRDVTAAVGHGKTLLGAVCAWTAADRSAERMAAIVSAGDPVSWGLTEEGRGSDIGRSATTARLGADSIAVDGHKWPIGNATRGRAITVLARTAERPGPRSLSLVLVDKQEVDGTTLTYRPRRPLHGIRGADISGIDFQGTRVDADGLVGPEGHGLELVLKSLQLTRTLCAALSLGAGDHALRLVLDSSHGGGSIARRDPDVVSTAVADQLLAEVVGFVGARTIHSAPEEMGLVSAFVKYLVPDAVDSSIREIGGALGAEAQLTSGRAAHFQKIARDARVVAIFDGNSVVNLNVIAGEFANIVRAADGPAPDPGAVSDTLGFDVRPATLDLTRLRLLTRRGSTLLAALPGLVADIDTDRTPPDIRAAAQALAAAFDGMVTEARRAERASRPPVQQFALAERFAFAFAGAAALAVHRVERARMDTPLWDDDLWLRAVLHRIGVRLGVTPIGQRSYGKQLAATSEALIHSGQTVSVLPRWWNDRGAA